MTKPLTETPSPRAMKAAIEWKVLRKTRARAAWRVVYEGPELSARRTYREIYDVLRVGGLSLMRPDGTCEVRFYKPAYHTLNKPPLKWELPQESMP